MGRRVLAAFVHVVGEDGESVVLTPGTKVPTWAAAQITNPAAFVDGNESEPSEPAIPASEPVTAVQTPAAPAETPTGTTETPTGTPAETTETPTGTPAETTETPTGTPAETTETPTGTPAETTETPTVTPVDGYVSLSFSELQAAAKARNLSGAGTAETLRARLEADDRDKAATTGTAE